MAGDHRPPDDWGTNIARTTFKWTLILAVAYIATVFIFILR